MIVALPGETPVTSPLLETDAIARFEDNHVTVRPVSVLPAASLMVAESVWVVPTNRERLPGLMLTVAAGVGPVFVGALGAESPADPHATAVIMKAPCIARSNAFGRRQIDMQTLTVEECNELMDA